MFVFSASLVWVNGFGINERCALMPLVLDLWQINAIARRVHVFGIFFIWLVITLFQLFVGIQSIILKLRWFFKQLFDSISLPHCAFVLTDYWGSLNVLDWIFFSHHKTTVLFLKKVHLLILWLFCLFAFLFFFCIRNFGLKSES